MSSLFSGPLSISLLLQSKALTPLDSSARAIVERIESRDVTGYSEADVREEIVSPLLSVLGYDKDSSFSIEREKRIRLPGRSRFLDYAITPWSRNFWLIEAKSAKGRRRGFSARDIEQAVGYAAHPEINAALVVLCDGWKIAVYDREEDLSHPLLSVQVSKITASIDSLRMLLGPWQAWLFEKRRIVRHLDRVFDKEFNMGRVEEFKTLVCDRLDSKRSVVIDNMRSLVTNDSSHTRTIEVLRSLDHVDLVESCFFRSWSQLETTTIAQSLLEHCQRSIFPVVHRVFPDQLRTMNDDFCMHALNFLFHLESKRSRADWLPKWLDAGNDVAAAVKTFLELCLTQFATDPARRAMLLCAAAIRRFFKVSMVTNTWGRHMGEMRHALTRFYVPEDAWQQRLSSPQGEMMIALDGLVVEALGQLLRRCSDEFGRVEAPLLEVELRGIWSAEHRILQEFPNVWHLVHAQQVHESRWTEHVDVVYDYLGHCVLCIAEDHPNWKTYILQAHLDKVERISAMGSWQARRWLGCEDDKSQPLPSDQWMADRFFLGDIDVYRRLKDGYSTD